MASWYIIMTGWDFTLRSGLGDLAVCPVLGIFLFYVVWQQHVQLALALLLLLGFVPDGGNALGLFAFFVALDFYTGWDI